MTNVKRRKCVNLAAEFAAIPRYATNSVPTVTLQGFVSVLCRSTYFNLTTDPLTVLSKCRPSTAPCNPGLADVAHGLRADLGSPPPPKLAAIAGRRDACQLHYALPSQIFCFARSTYISPRTTVTPPPPYPTFHIVLQ